MERDNSKGKEKLGESSIKNGQEQDFLPPPPPPPPPRSVSAEESEEIKRQKVSCLPSPPSSSSNLAPPGRRFGGGGGGGALCQAERCTADLSEAKRYHRRHKVCETHSKAPVVIVSGLHQRFCQQCSRFHELTEFDDSKRSCRRRLAGHNERRRKSSSDQAVTATTATTSGVGSGEGSGRCRQTDPPQDGRRIPLNGSSNPPPFKHFHIT